MDTLELKNKHNYQSQSGDTHLYAQYFIDDKLFGIDLDESQVISLIEQAGMIVVDRKYRNQDGVLFIEGDEKVYFASDLVNSLDYDDTEKLIEFINGQDLSEQMDNGWMPCLFDYEIAI
jgi:predicted heme/steroid binding protein